MIEYSPFKKPFKELEAEDLEVLTRAYEGWHIEYKEEVPKAPAIAKSVSAFANTQGGCLFYGIEEKSKDDPVAGSFPGIDGANVESLWQRIQQAVPGNATPPPYFDVKVVWGPCDVIGLAADKGIFCIHVPWSLAAPHVHRDGRIYRRAGDQSDPKFENDRFLLDQLFRRADTFRQGYKEWIERDQAFSDVEGEKPYTRLLIVPSLWEDHDWPQLSITDVRATMGITTSPAGSVPFDTVYTSANGFVARQSAGNDPNNLALTWWLFPDFSSDVLIPLELFRPSIPSLPWRELRGYEGGYRFQQVVEKRGFAVPRIVDLNALFLILRGVVATENLLLKKAGWTDGFFFKVQLLNVWRTCPFLDVASVLSVFEKHGVPMCLSRTTLFPPGTDPETFAKMNPLEGAESDVDETIVQAAAIFDCVASVYGLPGATEHDLTPYYLDLCHAGDRFLQVQAARKERR